MLNKLFKKNPDQQSRVNLKARFELKSEMGMGTMSKVWKAHDRDRHIDVALKIVDREMLEKVSAKLPKVERPSEGEVSERLKHPFIVQTLEHGISQDGEPFLVMEYVDGVGLQQFIETQNDTMKKKCFTWMLQIGEAMTYFHEQNFIHRDLCPKNILVDKSGRIKLIDFGLAVPNTPPFLAPGNRTGTMDYMAPELVKRQRTDQRIDVYSFAVTCYQMCCNRLPYLRSKNIESIIKNLNQPPRDIRESCPGIPEQLAAIIMRGLEKHPDDRWQSTLQMTQALKSIAQKKKPR